MELKATATIGEVIGWNIRERRAARWTQPQFGQLMGTVLPKPWPAQTVSSAEKGERAYAAAELVAIAQLLEVPVAALFSPPLPVQRVVVTDDLVVPAQTLHDTPGPINHHDDFSTSLYAEAWSTLGRIAKLRQNIVEQTEQIEQESRSLFIRLDEIAGGAADVHTSELSHATMSTDPAIAAAIDDIMGTKEERQAPELKMIYRPTRTGNVGGDPRA
jgi:transcriptional regulator with XRE-family HTH domain